MDNEPLAMPAFVDWPMFPFEGELTMRALAPFLDSEYPRAGEPGGQPHPAA